LLVRVTVDPAAAAVTGELEFPLIEDARLEARLLAVDPEPQLNPPAETPFTMTV